MTHAAPSAALTAAWLVTALACSRTPTPAGVGAPSPVASSEAAASASAPASGASRAAALPDGCWSGFATDVPAAAAPGERLKALADRCAQGMKPLVLAAATAKLETGGSQRQDFELPSAAGCVRVLAVGDSGVVDLALDLLDASNTSRGADQLRAPFALAPEPGNVCLEPGKYHAVVAMTSGAGSVAFSAYAAE